MEWGVKGIMADVCGRLPDEQQCVVRLVSVGGYGGRRW